MKRRRRVAIGFGTVFLLAAFAGTWYVFYLERQTAQLLASQPRPQAVERYERIQEALKKPSAAAPTTQKDAPSPAPEAQEAVADILAPLERAKEVFDRAEAELKADWQALYNDLFSRPVSEWSAADWKRLDAFLDKHSDLLAEVRAMAAESGPLYPLDFSKGYALELPHLAPTRELARLLQASAVARGHQGDVAGAREDILAGLQLARRVREEPIIISQLVGAAIDGIMQDSVTSAFSEGHIPPDLAAELARNFQASSLADSLHESIAGERQMGVDFMAQLMAGRSFSDQFDPFGQGNDLASNLGGYLYASPLARPWQYRDVESYTQIMNEFENTLSMPLYEARPTLDSLASEVEALPFTRVFTRSMIPSMFSLHEAIARDEAREQLLLIGAAVESYASEHGAYPPDLNSVRGQTNGASITDPFTGSPLHYTPSGNGFELYSVGRDQEDDGGRQDFNNGDIVWRGTPASAGANLVARR